jgi:predicted transposase/invertase (TIGR01784 family)
MEYDYATDIEVQREEAFSQGSHQKAIETAKNMLNDKLDIQTILKYTGLSIEEINALAK